MINRSSLRDSLYFNTERNITNEINNIEIIMFMNIIVILFSDNSSNATLHKR